jgi:hypothetical protein
MGFLGVERALVEVEIRGPFALAGAQVCGALRPVPLASCRGRSASGVADAVDDAIGVVGDEQRAIGGHGGAGEPAEVGAVVVEQPAGDEVLEAEWLAACRRRRASRSRPPARGG